VLGETLTGSLPTRHRFPGRAEASAAPGSVREGGLEIKVSSAHYVRIIDQLRSGMSISRLRRSATRTRGVRVFVIPALLAVGVVLFAVQIGASIAAPIERPRADESRGPGTVGEVGGDLSVPKSLDPAASRDSIPNPLAGGSTHAPRTSVEPGHNDSLQLLLSSDSSGMCTGEVAQRTRSSTDLPSTASSAIGSRCRLDRGKLR